MVQRTPSETSSRTPYIVRPHDRRPLASGRACLSRRIGDLLCLSVHSEAKLSLYSCSPATTPESADLRERVLGAPSYPSESGRSQCPPLRRLSELLDGPLNADAASSYRKPRPTTVVSPVRTGQRLARVQTTSPGRSVRSTTMPRRRSRRQSRRRRACRAASSLFAGVAFSGASEEGRDVLEDFAKSSVCLSIAALGCLRDRPGSSVPSHPSRNRS